MVVIRVPANVVKQRVYNLEVQPGATAYVMGIAQARPQIVRKLRVPGEFRTTSKPFFHGDKECDNIQLKLDVTAPIVSSGGPVLFPFSMAVALGQMFPGAETLPPSNGEFYTSADVNYHMPQQAYVTHATPYLDVYGHMAGGVGSNVSVSFCMYQNNYCSNYTQKFTQYSIGGSNVVLSERYVFIRDFSGDPWYNLYMAQVLSLTDSYNWDGNWGGYGYVSGWRYGSPDAVSIRNAWASGTSDPFHIMGLVSPPPGAPLPTSLPLYTSTSYFSWTDEIEGNVLAVSSSLLKYCSEAEYGVTHLDKADLCDSAIDNCHAVSLDSLAFVGDFIKLVKGIVEIFHGDFGSIPSTFQDLWLSGRYGLRLTAKDSVSLFKAIKRELSRSSVFQTVHSRRTLYPSFLGPVASYKLDLAYKVYLGAQRWPALAAIQRMMDWDIWPTLENSWDLIPYSFVVDWIVDIQGFLDDIDRTIYDDYLNLQSIIWSERHEMVIKNSLNLGYGLVVDSGTFVHYHRHHQSNFDIAPLRVERGHLSNINIIDGASLLLQRLI